MKKKSLERIKKLAEKGKEKVDEFHDSEVKEEQYDKTPQYIPNSKIDSCLKAF